VFIQAGGLPAMGGDDLTFKQGQGKLAIGASIA